MMIWKINTSVWHWEFSCLLVWNLRAEAVIKIMLRTCLHKDVFLHCSLLDLFKEASSSITLENVLEKHTFASTHSQSMRSVVEKTITTEKLEDSVNVHNFIRLLLWFPTQEFPVRLLILLFFMYSPFEQL